MPSRSFGQKSRHGCDRCKKRHVKCNEAVPCNHCARRNEHCSLLDTKPDRVYPLRNDKLPISQGLSPLSTLSGSSSTPASARSESPTWALDLYLMSHFSTDTVYTFSSYHTLIDAWQTTIIRDAVSYPFLQHGILAISALHLASKPRYSDDGDGVSGDKDGIVVPHDYVRAFRHHQNEAIPQYLNMLQNLDMDGNEEFRARSREPWPAGPVFAMAVLTGITAVAGVSDNTLPLHPSEEDLWREEDETVAPSPAPSPSVKEAARLDLLFDRFLSIFVSIRGIRAVVAAAQEEQIFRGTVYRHLMGPYLETDHLPVVPMGPRSVTWYDTLKAECLDDLVNRGGGADGSREWDICTAAILSLQKVHEGAVRLLEVKRDRLGHVQRDGILRFDIGWFLKWTAIVSQEFLALARERHAAALVILAQFAAVCGLSEDEWYMKNWVKNAIAAIRHRLGPGKGMDWMDRIEGRWVNQELSPSMLR